MRISTNTFFESSINRITDIQSKLNKTQQQISAGKRLGSPSDDPLAAAQSVDINHAIAINEQFAKNRMHLTSKLNQADNLLVGIVDTLNNIHDIALQANSGTSSEEDKINLASNLQSAYDQLLQLANSKDSFGNFLLGGGGTSADGSPVQVSRTGDFMIYKVSKSDGIKVDSTTNKIYYNSDGGLIGNPIPNGSLVYIKAVDVDKLGTYSGLEPVKPDGVLSQNLFIQVDTKSNIKSSISSSDLFFKDSTNVFERLQDVISSLKNNNTNGVDGLIENVSSTLSHVSTVQSDIGNRLNTLDQLDTIGSARGLQLTSSLSGLQDLDYTNAISELTKQQTILQAAQKTFGQVSSMSLFDFIK